MTRAARIEEAARIAMHWFDPRGEGQHPEDPDMSPREMYWMLKDAIEGLDDQPHLKSVA